MQFGTSHEALVRGQSLRARLEGGLDIRDALRGGELGVLLGGGAHNWIGLAAV
jgi:hypothetical protein